LTVIVRQELNFLAKKYKIMIVFLDSGIVGLASSPRRDGEVFSCKQWILKLIARSAYVVSSDLCDYEVRRGLILASFPKGEKQGIENLNKLKEIVDFLPVTTTNVNHLSRFIQAQEWQHITF
jgi:hypothetical protein